MSADGQQLGADFRTSGAAATAFERYPMVAHNSTANQYLVVWSDERDVATRGFDIYGRRVARQRRIG